jgi:hypothetical protein
MTKRKSQITYLVDKDCIVQNLGEICRDFQKVGMVIFVAVSFPSEKNRMDLLPSGIAF